MFTKFAEHFKHNAHLLAILPVVVAAVGLFFGTVFAYKFAQLHFSFWAGLLAPFVLILFIFVVIFATHPKTLEKAEHNRNTVIALIDFVAFVGVALLVILPGLAQFNWVAFAWGGVDSAILAVLYVVILFTIQQSRIPKS